MRPSSIPTEALANVSRPLNSMVPVPTICPPVIVDAPETVTLPLPPNWPPLMPSVARVETPLSDSVPEEEIVVAEALE